MIRKQIKISRMIIQTIKSPNIVINMVWVTQGPGTFGIYQFPCISNDTPTHAILPNDDLGHQVPEYSNSYGLGDLGVPGPLGYTIAI